MTALMSRHAIVAELARDTTLSPRHRRRVAAVVIAARWGRRPRSYIAYLAAARRRQAGAGFAGPLLTVTEEQLARADADIGWRLDPAGRAAARAARDAHYGRAPFRLTPYGLERETDGWDNASAGQIIHRTG